MKKLLFFIFALQVNAICFAQYIDRNTFQISSFSNNPVTITLDTNNKWYISSPCDTENDNKNSLILNMVAVAYLGHKKIDSFKPGNIWSVNNCPDYRRSHNTLLESDDPTVKLFKNLNSNNYGIINYRNNDSFKINITNNEKSNLNNEKIYYLGIKPFPFYQSELSYEVTIKTSDAKAENNKLKTKKIETVTILGPFNKKTIHSWLCPLVNYSFLIGGLAGGYLAYHKWFKK